MSTKRTKTAKGTYRAARSDTTVGTIEKKYGVKLGVRSDMKIGNYLSKKGYPSLSAMIRSSR